MNPDLSNVYWVGGSQSGGKSTVAKILGDRYGLAVYHCDDHFLDHISRVKQSESPVMYELNKGRQVDPGAYLDLPFEELTRRAPFFRRERFVEAIKDLREMSDQPLIAEGVVFRPGLVAEVADVRKAVCLVPTQEFWHAVFSKRNDPGHERTKQRFSNPERMEKGIRLAKWGRELLVGKGREVGVKVIVNDGKRGLEAMAMEVAEHWGLK